VQQQRCQQLDGAALLGISHAEHIFVQLQ
jgi:hypothetical protein